MTSKTQGYEPHPEWTQLKERRQRAADLRVAQALTKILDTTAFDLHDPVQHSTLKELQKLRLQYYNRAHGR